MVKVGEWEQRRVRVGSIKVGRHGQGMDIGIGNGGDSRLSTPAEETGSGWKGPETLRTTWKLSGPLCHQQRRAASQWAERPPRSKGNGRNGQGCSHGHVVPATEKPRTGGQGRGRVGEGGWPMASWLVESLIQGARTGLAVVFPGNTQRVCQQSWHCQGRGCIVQRNPK